MKNQMYDSENLAEKKDYFSTKRTPWSSEIGG
jgi:hypothetical protein